MEDYTEWGVRELIAELEKRDQKGKLAKTKKIKIDFTESDLQELMNGKTFDWTYDGVDVHLFKGEQCEECGEDVECLNDAEDGRQLCNNCYHE